MDQSPSIEVVTDQAHDVADAELEDLLTSVYVGEGFTDPEVAKTIFAPTAVRARGQLLVARRAGSLLGTLILVPPGAPACRVAKSFEAELHLMAVRPAHRRLGIGKILVRAALEHAQRQTIAGIALSTQPTMHAAHRLYESFGFSRDPARDWNVRDRTFLVFQRQL